MYKLEGILSSVQLKLQFNSLCLKGKHGPNLPVSFSLFRIEGRIYSCDRKAASELKRRNLFASKHF